MQAGLSTPGNLRNTTKSNYFYCTTTFIHLFMSILLIMNQTIFLLRHLWTSFVTLCEFWTSTLRVVLPLVALAQFPPSQKKFPSLKEQWADKRPNSSAIKAALIRCTCQTMQVFSLSLLLFKAFLFLLVSLLFVPSSSDSPFVFVFLYFMLITRILADLTIESATMYCSSPLLFLSGPLAVHGFLRKQIPDVVGAHTVNLRHFTHSTRKYNALGWQHATTVCLCCSACREKSKYL